MSDRPPTDPRQIADAAAAFFGEPVLQVTAPGGRRRASCRIALPGRSVIATLRRDPKQMALEADILTALAPHTDTVPRLLGTVDGILFQTDCGPDRLNRVIHTTAPADRPALAARAVEALFQIQRAGLAAGLQDRVPAEGLSRYPDHDLLAIVPRAAEQLDCPLPGYDPAALHPWFRARPVRFIKWDCRSGNAAVGSDGVLRFFDFEDARLGQGPEDFGWLISDENWPLPMAGMLDLVAARLTQTDTAKPEAYMDYLAQYSVLQALRRVRLIFREAQSGGWVDRITILKYDRVGTNPHLCERLCAEAGALARSLPALRELERLFDLAAAACRRARSA